MSTLELWEFLSYVVTVVGLPFAIIVYLFDKRKERANEDEEIYQQLSDEDEDFAAHLRQVADEEVSRESVNP